MSNDSFTEVTSQSWGSRLGGAFKGIITGIVLFIIAFPLLFWNEGRAVKRHKTLEEGGGVVISVSADSVDSSNSGNLIHVLGKADTEEILNDPVFGVSENVLKLNRLVEMYQWEETSDSETKKKIGGGTETTTTYTYQKIWSDDLINSSEFKKPDSHTNPDDYLYDSRQFTADNITLGAFTLTSSLITKINNFEPLTPDSLPGSLEGEADIYNNGFFVGRDPAEPQIGDLRISFSIVKPGEVSVIAAQISETFEPYITQVEGTIELLQTGTHSAEAMIQKAQDDNRKLTWILRAVGFALMFFGLLMIFKPLSVLADILPILGSMIGFGTGIFAFLLAAVMSLITIGIAWIFYRPLIGISLIALAMVLIVLVIIKLKSGK